ncbi:MAG TPA: 3-hydroxyacyl-CoA dehydrogenase NAD-binding domain-containing protein [Candidatus Baltobacteraceae bacterium]|nr:3-hydroxyacyl-CoA dehydrogenase NAD-binding domain-containing protein [Candidatus Baltobacteraceae bacterium]
MSKIVVIGGGTMGAGIAFLAAAGGFDVDLIEPDPAASERARQRIAKDAERAKIPDAPARVQIYSALQAGAQADAVIEAVPERLDLKRDIFARMAQTFDANTLFATNTSSLSVGEIAQGVPHPQRVLGLHFFNPPAAMKLVEIVRADDTDDETLARARAIVEKLGKTAVLTADTPGFIVNRVARPYYLQAMRAYEAGVAPIEDLDRLARGTGFRMGPFELIDLIGMDVNLATSQSVYERTQAGRFEPVAVQREMVAQGRLGRKSGAGFYDYSKGPAPHDDQMPKPADEVDHDERITVIGYAGLALEMQERLERHYANVFLLEDEEQIDEIPADTTIVFDVGDGASERDAIIEALDAQLPPETVIFVDGYANEVGALAKRLKHPERIVAYGILSTLEHQRVVEIVDAHETSDDALELAQDVFESIGCGVALVENRAGLFLGRTIGSIVNEAVYVVQDEIASPEDVDLAMRLGTNYPRGPIEWGQEIGGDRIRRILQRLAAQDGAELGPSRALWVLDVRPAQDEEQEQQDAFVDLKFGG